MDRDSDTTDTPEGFLDIRPGTRLGDWRVLRALGQGRFGRVYEATYEGGPRAGAKMPARAALKVFEDTLLLSPAARAELSKEARAMASVSHPNVLRFHDDVTLAARSEYAGTRFFVLELGETDLLEEMNRSPAGLPVDEVTAIAVDLAAGLRAVHRKYVHGDVKPENIIKVERLHKLGDMGVAARLEGTGAYPRPGTMRYRPPEYGRRQGSRQETLRRERVGQPYDIWGLGVTLHEILTKRHPFEAPGERLDPQAIFARAQSGEAPVIEVADPVLAEVIGRCLEPDETRRATAQALLDILGTPADFVARPQSPPPAPPRRWNAPHRDDPHLRVRAGLALDLRLGWQGHGVVGLVGPEGAGKTALTVAHARSHAEDYDVAWWVRARRPETLRSDLAELAGPLGLGEHPTSEDDRIEAVRCWLEGHDRWLVVFDDITGEDAWAAVAATRGPGHVLGTTTSTLPTGAAAVVEVGSLGRDDAVAFLLARTGDGDGAAATQLAEALTDMPLVVALAGATVTALDTSLAGYLERLRRRAPELFTGPPDPQRAVAAAVAIAFDHVQRTSPAAAEMVQLCAFLDCDDIPLDLFARAVGALPKAAQRAFGRGGAEAAVSLLERSGLLGHTGDALFLHALVADALRQALGAEDRRRWAAVALATLHAGRGATPDGDWGRRILPHLLTALEHPGATDEPDVTAGILKFLAATRRAAGRLHEARDHLERALAVTEAAKGPEHADVGALRFDLGSLLVGLGDHDAARRHLERSAAIADVGADLPGDDDDGERLHTLGVLLRDLGEYEQARACLDQSLSVVAAAHGPDDAEVGVRLNDLGSVLREIGDHSAARECFEHSVAIGEAVHGPDHAEVGARLSNLALVLLDTGQFSAGRDAVERSLAIAEAVHGPDHPEVGARHNILGMALTELGAFAEARRHLELAVAIAERAHGDGHPEVGSARANLGMALRGLGDGAGARVHLEAAVTAAQATHGPNHPQVGDRLNSLGMVLHDLGEDRAARRAFERSLGIALATHGPGHPEAARRHNNLALALLNLGDYAGARRHLEAAVAPPDSVRPIDAPVVAPLLAEDGSDTAIEHVAPAEPSAVQGVGSEIDGPADVVPVDAPDDELPVARRRQLRPLRRRTRIAASAGIAVLTAACWATALGFRTSTIVEDGATVVLALDVSLSMEATDVAPSRLAAAQAAATRFVDRLPADLKIGLVSFSGIANAAVLPTKDRGQVKDAISKLELQPRTAVGEAVFVSLGSISPNPDQTPPARIVVLTDGETTTGRTDAVAARAASERSVPVATIALGTPDGFVSVEGRNIPVPVNKDAMRAVAEMTSGRFYEAASAEELDRAYDDLRSFLPYRTVRSGLTAMNVAMASLLGAICGAIAWLLLGWRRDAVR